jgi:hypothetical protein
VEAEVEIQSVIETCALVVVIVIAVAGEEKVREMLPASWIRSNCVWQN